MESLSLSQSRASLMTKNKIRDLEELNKNIIACQACERLVSWRQEVARTKRKAYQAEVYWGRPVPSFGSNSPKILVVGLAPGAHGANRTGRIFTGDSSGDWLYRSLYRNGLAKIPTSTSIEDGQELFDTRITCAVRCVPPENKPSILERDNCAPWLEREIEIAYSTLRSIVALGSFAWGATIKALGKINEGGEFAERPPKFAHGAMHQWRGSDGNSRAIFSSYHPSQQNTFTGKLTEAALDQVFEKAGRFAR
jgi:uracil-DNA glycosylase family 4